MRILLLLAVVAFFSIYAWRNWFVSLCASIVLMAVVQHPDFPNSLGGIQGLNPWNILFLNVFLAWLLRNDEKGGRRHLPRYFKFGVIGMSVTVLVGFFRLAADPANLEDYTLLSGTSEYLLNNLKWLVVGVLFFDACRSRQRVEKSLFCILAIYVLLAVQVIRWVPLGMVLAGDDSFARISYKMTQNEIGYNRVTLSMMLGGASWAIFAMLPLVRSQRNRFLVLACSGIAVLGQALTGGRTGYVAWAAVGIVLCAARWRKVLFLIPVTAAAVLIFLPSVRERMLFGFGSTEGHVSTQSDETKITSGRTTIWPHVIEKISEAPIAGYGRLAMRRTGLTSWLMEEHDEDFGHPHNAYLEQLLDNGVIGFIAVVPFFFIALRRSWQLFLDKNDPLYGAVGGVVCALILALLVGSLAGQTFYPREGAVGLWAALGVMARVAVERGRARASGRRVFAPAATRRNRQMQDHPEPALA